MRAHSQLLVAWRLLFIFFFHLKIFGLHDFFESFFLLSQFLFCYKSKHLCVYNTMNTYRKGSKYSKCDDTFNYCILAFPLVFSALATILKCKTCDTDVKFTKTGIRDLAFKINVECALW